MNDPVDLGARAAAAAMRNGEMTAEAYADALIERAAKGAQLNAFIHHDVQAVRAAARAADQRRKSGAPLGPLHGVPLALKDNLDTANVATTGGTPGLAHNIPAHNAPVVKKLLGAGAIVFGKANLHELAFGITCNNAAYGASRNPYDPARIPGGSSGGTGVAVGARMVPAGIGTDTGGSVRIPAALCGIVGFRPTVGRWPKTGIVPISHTRDTAGPMARSVEDCVLLDGVVTGAAALEVVSLKGLKLGVPREYFWDFLDTELARLLESALGRLKDAGVVLVEVTIPNIAALDGAASFPIVLHEAATDLAAYLTAHGSRLDFAGLAAKVSSPDVHGILSGQAGQDAVPEAVYREALTRHRVTLQEAYRACFAQHGVAGLVFPTTPLPAALIGEDENVMLNGVPVPTFMTYIRNTDPGSVAGLPGLSLPAGCTASGMPVGIAIDAPAGADARLLAIGGAFERLLPRIPAPNV